MKIEKLTTTNVYTSDGKILHENDDCVFYTDHGAFWGRFLGLGKKGALRFDTPLLEFAVMPSSVKEIYLADVIIFNGEKEEEND